MKSNFSGGECSVESCSLEKPIKLGGIIVSCLPILKRSMLVSGMKDGTIIIWNTDTWEAVKDLKISVSAIYEILGIEGNQGEFSFLAFSLKDGSAHCFNIEKNMGEKKLLPGITNVDFGMGIQSKVQFGISENALKIAVVSQSAKDKSVSIWGFQ